MGERLRGKKAKSERQPCVTEPESRSEDKIQTEQQCEEGSQRPGIKHFCGKLGKWI